MQQGNDQPLRVRPGRLAGPVQGERPVPLFAGGQLYYQGEAGRARIDLDDGTVDIEDGVFTFELEHDIRHRLMNGLDDIGITLENAGAIDEFEAAGRAGNGPVTTAL